MEESRIWSVIPARTAKMEIPIKNRITLPYPLLGSLSWIMPVDMSYKDAPMVVADLTSPIPVPTNDKGKITGMLDTNPTGPSERLTLNSNMPITGVIIVYSSMSMEKSIDTPLPITREKRKKTNK